MTNWDDYKAQRDSENAPPQEAPVDEATTTEETKSVEQTPVEQTPVEQKPTYQAPAEHTKPAATVSDMTMTIPDIGILQQGNAAVTENAATTENAEVTENVVAQENVAMDVSSDVNENSAVFENSTSAEQFETHEETAPKSFDPVPTQEYGFTLVPSTDEVEESASLTNDVAEATDYVNDSSNNTAEEFDKMFGNYATSSSFEQDTDGIASNDTATGGIYSDGTTYTGGYASSDSYSSGAYNADTTSGEFTSDTYSTSDSYASNTGYTTSDNYGTAGDYTTNYGSADGYAASGSYGNGGDNYSTGSSKKAKKTKNAAKPLEITKKGFVLAIICAMILTSGMTVGGILAYENFLAPGTDSATNYKLNSNNSTSATKSAISAADETVVSITTESVSTDSWAANYVTQGAGSGVIVQSNGYIVTCYHVIEGASKITVTLNNGKEYSAEVIGADSENDLAVIKIKATKLTAASYGDSDSLEVGDAVVAIGNPLGELSNTATQGIISALNRNLTINNQTINLLQTDASVNPGNSGGGLFDSEGNLVGIVESKSTGSDVEGLGFAVPVNTVAASVKEIIENKGDVNSSSSNSGEQAYIGVTVTELSDEDAKSYGYSSGGVYISSVTGANAQEAGLQSGDRIVSVDGTKTSSRDKLSSVLKKHSPGDKVKIVIERNGREYQTTTELTGSGA